MWCWWTNENSSYDKTEMMKLLCDYILNIVAPRISQWYENQKDSFKQQSFYYVQYSVCPHSSHLVPIWWLAHLFSFWVIRIHT